MLSNESVVGFKEGKGNFPRKKSVEFCYPEEMLEFLFSAAIICTALISPAQQGQRCSWNKNLSGIPGLSLPLEFTRSCGYGKRGMDSS